tara:strand:- start:2658 stop:3260 length:603 start_codon:yes stop_codon:yes gene_type:complete
MRKNENVIPHVHHVSRADRNELNNHKSFVVWFTGLSGSGKSTLASLLEAELLKNGIRTYILDGDNVRTGLNRDLDFTDAGRVENIRRIGEVANLMVDAGLVVLSAFISPFEADRQQVAEIVGKDNFIEVFVDCPLQVCEQRDVKGLYAKARKGLIKNFTGIDSPFERPVNPDVVISSDTEKVEDSVDKLLLRLRPLTVSS